MDCDAMIWTHSNIITHCDITMGIPSNVIIHFDAIMNGHCGVILVDLHSENTCLYI